MAVILDLLAIPLMFVGVLLIALANVRQHRVRKRLSPKQRAIEDEQDKADAQIW